MSAQTIYHHHHVIPRHLNSPCPIAEITICISLEDHAEAHKLLFLEYGRWQDEIAWKVLSGMIKPQEAIATAQKLGGIEGAKRAKEEMLGFWNSETQEKNARKSHVKNKKNKKGFWDSKLQLELGKRGAKASGLGTRNSANNIKMCCLGCGKTTSLPTFKAHHIKKCF